MEIWKKNLEESKDVGGVIECYRILLMAGWNICSWSRGGADDLYALSPLFPLSNAGLAAVFTLTQSGMITALINSCIDIPRSSASVCRSSKLSSRRDSMNFANLTPKEWGGLSLGFSNINILRRESRDYFHSNQ